LVEIVRRMVRRGAVEFDPTADRHRRSASVRYCCSVAGYSNTPVAKKLGVAEGTTLALLAAPSGWATELPPQVAVRRRAGGLWIAWPKKASGVASDLSDNAIRAAVLPRGLVDNKVCALDETWSALRLVWRRQKRVDPAKD
jgi:hypothetical protein